MRSVRRHGGVDETREGEDMVDVLLNVMAAAVVLVLAGCVYITIQISKVNRRR